MLQDQLTRQITTRNTLENAFRYIYVNVQTSNEQHQTTENIKLQEY